MRRTPTRRSWRGRAVAALAVAVAAAGVVVAGPGALPAHAEPRVTIANERGQAQADLTYSTPVTVSGSGFQSIDKGFGGIYVLFGTVTGTWQPSKGGVTGTNLLYVPDEQTKDNQGFQRFVAYPGSETEYAANGGVIAADGTWSLTMTIPGSRFQTTAADGSTVTVDCTTTTCGIITIGAHGVKNANNESFTPVAFCDMQAAAGSSGACGAASSAGGAGGGSGSTDAGQGGAGQSSGAQGAGSGSGSGSTGGGSTGGGSGSGSAGGADGASGDAGAGGTGADSTGDAGSADGAGTAGGTATVGIDQSTAVVGRVLGFTGQGFTPGEQVVGSLSGGMAAVGPLVAGSQGEVAGVLQLPSELRPGTQTFRLTGAGSSRVAELEFTVIQDPTVAAAQANLTRQQPTRTSPWVIVVGAVGLLVLGLIIASARAARLRRTAAGASGPAAASGPVVPPAPLPPAPLPPAPLPPAPVRTGPPGRYAADSTGTPVPSSVPADDRPTQALPPQSPAFPPAEVGR